MEKEVTLQIKDLELWFDNDRGSVKILNGISFDIYKGETLGIVGESGCGKSVTSLSIMRLLQSPPARFGGSIKLQDKELLKLYSPTILTALQTNNYPVASTLRRTNITQNDEDGKTWTTGAKIKRVLDHEIEVDGEKISSTSGLDKYSAYRDQLGWIAIATYKEGGSAPTDISTVTADKGKGLNVRIVDGRVYVDGASQFSIYSITGKKLPSNTMLTAGFYIIQANGMNKKILVK